MGWPDARRRQIINAETPLTLTNRYSVPRVTPRTDPHHSGGGGLAKSPTLSQGEFIRRETDQREPRLLKVNVIQLFLRGLGHKN